MSKIFEALERAQKEGMKRFEKPHDLLPSADDEKSIQTDYSSEMIDEMIILGQSIDAALPDLDHKIVLFVGSKTNEGTSTIAKQLAKVYSQRLEKTVLLVDLDRSRPDMSIYEKIRPEMDMEEAIKTGQSVEKALCQVEDTSLYVMPVFQKTMVSPRTIEAVKKANFWDALRERFDLIIVDAPPASVFPDGLATARNVDGVVLVVEAEKTRWQVAVNVKEKIIQHGGKIIGTVFNKRRYYIPDSIYKYL